MKSPKTTKKNTTKAPTNKSAPKKATPKAKKTEQPVKVEVTKVTPKKASPKKKTPKKTPVVAANPIVATEEKSIPDRIGSTAGSIWHYLTENGNTAVAKVLREIKEDEKIIQRSIGWLAQEGKITLDTTSRGEIISLK